MTTTKWSRGGDEVEVDEFAKVLVSRARFAMEFSDPAIELREFEEGIGFEEEEEEEELLLLLLPGRAEGLVFLEPFSMLSGRA